MSGPVSRIGTLLSIAGVAIGALVFAGLLASVLAPNEQGRRSPERSSHPAASGPNLSECEPTPLEAWTYIGPRGPWTVRMLVGGKLASFGPAQETVGIINKRTWLLRDGPRHEWITLRATYLHGPGEQLFYVAHCTNCGVPVPAWGNMYSYAQSDFGFRKLGCWRIELVDGQPEDYVVIRVVPRTT